MNLQSRAQRGYARPAPFLRPARHTEYDVMAGITHRLRDAARKGNTAFADLAQALHENMQLWTVLATDVADKDNALPKELRAQIFYLAEFTQQHTHKVLDGSSSVRPLLEINVAILKGLRHRSEAP
ncbi:flagellar biosynthesis regulator FlaF [Cognatishimia sp. 1_MG-2023]|uniref:flagellar biosynthesis regulator FlaF n=1 Tax=Cognatishimia sp. 1_MG-2023 TaxID=3062642 RepID=UPI0026E1F990|nr:flagellar biosynthesis regulator FlaF [Cognatishimia sp. 1_MG-2023]MDO6726947.1 flagellar biosynthesis regulator FlaF [Cognatishimia sp. 1_MG-2023]